MHDLRRPTPLLVKDHRYGLPINSVHFHDITSNVLSSDAKSIKIWDRVTGNAFTSIEPKTEVNQMVVYPKSGLIMAAAKHSHVQVWYIPQLGIAPRWTSYLDSLTEDLEEALNYAMYDDYAFVTREELEDWGVSDLIGTNLLKAYMHGFFMDSRLHDKVKAVGTGGNYEDFLQNKVNDEMKKKTDDRITIRRRLPKVNRELASLLLKSKNVKNNLNEASLNSDEKKLDDTFVNPLLDNRFASMFTDKSFEIDTNSTDYMRVNPHGANAAKRRGAMNDEDDRFNLVVENDDENEDSSSEEDVEAEVNLHSENEDDDENDDDSDEELVFGTKKSKLFTSRLQESQEGGDRITSKNNHQNNQNQQAKKAKKSKKRMFSLAEGLGLDNALAEKNRAMSSLPLGTYLILPHVNPPSLSLFQYIYIYL